VIDDSSITEASATSVAAHWPQLAGAGLVARHQEPSDDLEADFEELGRALAGKCEATFAAVVMAQTTDPLLTAAAERGRAEALETPSRQLRCVGCDEVIVAIAVEAAHRCPARRRRWTRFRLVETEPAS
jgi:hypothetical protein